MTELINDRRAIPSSEWEAGESRLEATHLQKFYGSRKAVKDVSLMVRKGEVVGLLGPNGAGKTTSFYMIVGLVHASAGGNGARGSGLEAGRRKLGESGVEEVTTSHLRTRLWS